MGANQSRPDSEDEKVFHNETPISFSPDVVNQLADRAEGPQTTPERQSILDAHIRARIQDELEHLKKDEEVVRQEIENALEKENLDKETAMAGEEAEGDDSSAGRVRNSAALMGDLEDIRAKIEKYSSNKKLPEYPEVEARGAAVAECYKKNKNTPLECWAEVSKFKASVDHLEETYFRSLQ
jgi:altered-inheritance-of-mitochondria protein 13